MITSLMMMIVNWWAYFLIFLMALKVSTKIIHLPLLELL